MPAISDDAIAAFKRTAGMLQNAGNVPGALAQFAKINPQAAMIANMCSGRSMRDVFYSECRARGIDPDALANKMGIA